MVDIRAESRISSLLNECLKESVSGYELSNDTDCTGGVMRPVPGHNGTNGPASGLTTLTRDQAHTLAQLPPHTSY